MLETVQRHPEGNLHMLTVRKPKKFALGFVLQYLFWIFKQCPLVSDNNT